ncbi:MAG: glycosyltransferase [Egibacteraceae bacterium]
MRVLLWHVHGSYTTALVQGRHTYLLPVEPGRGPDGRGRARTWDWPERARELTREELARTDVDVVVLQRPAELEGLGREWLGGRVPGRDLPALYLEHNAPQGRIAELRHPAADRTDLVVVHVTAFNDLFWDCGRTPTRVIEHGIVDPGHRYTGELARAAVVVNEPLRRGRVTGTDLLPRFAAAAPLDLYGMGVGGLELAGVVTHENVVQAELHTALARRRAYLHPIRWTSLGLALIEAMQLGLPVVAVGATEAFEAVPPECGVVSTDVDRLAAALRRLIGDADLARAHGEKARAYALERYGLARFLREWDALFEEVTA